MMGNEGDMMNRVAMPNGESDIGGFGVAKTKYHPKYGDAITNCEVKPKEKNAWHHNLT